MNDLYKDADVSSTFNFDEEVLKKALKNIYSKDFHPMTDIENNLFDEIWGTMNSATDKGFSQSVNPDNDFREAIKHNNAVFSAFKVHRMQKDMAARLLDSNGNLKPFEQWSKEVLPIADHQVGRWLKTEYDTAVIRAHQAADWQQFEREKDILPNLKWMPSTSIHPGADHQVFWGTVRPINDKFWNEHRPGDRWNCKCSLSATDEPITNVPGDIKTIDIPQKGLDSNPGKDGVIFSDKHPYFPKDCKHCAFYKPTLKNSLKHFFLSSNKNCYNCNNIENVLDKKYICDEIKQTLVEIKKTFKPKGIAYNIGSLPPIVGKFCRSKNIQLKSDFIYISDSNLLHSIRLVKKALGKTVQESELVNFPLMLNECEIYWDTTKENFWFVTRQNGRFQKFIIQPNYKLKTSNNGTIITNAFITAGIIQLNNIGPNVKSLIKIK